MLAVEQSMALNTGGVMLVVCVHVSSCGQWWSCVVFMGGGRLVLLCALRVFVAAVGWSWSFVRQLSSFVDGWDRVSRWASCDVTWGQHGGEAHMGCRWAMC